VVSPNIVDQDADHCQVVWRNLFVTYTVGPATEHNIIRLCSNLRAFFAGTERAGFALITNDTTRPPDVASRRKVVEVFRQHQARLAGVAICIEAVGFTSAILRAVTSALFVLEQHGLPVKFFGSTNDAGPWLASTTGLPLREVLYAFKFARNTVGR
jgi:hypothetical protein